MTRILFFIAVAGSAMPVYAMDCKREWIQACVGSDQDKYRQMHDGGDGTVNME